MESKEAKSCNLVNRLDDKIDRLNEKIHANHVETLKAINKNKVENAILKTKVSLWGLVCGSAPIIADYLHKKMGGS